MEERRHEVRRHRLPSQPEIPVAIRDQLRRDFEAFATGGLPGDLEAYVKATYHLDVRSVYAGQTIRNPWGKGSGQLTMRPAQILEAADAGLGFVVLKTVIAEDSAGTSAMSAWAIRESRMVAEPISGKESGEPGWTITWKGRGWWQSFDDYLQLVRDAVEIGASRKMRVAASVKYHLPAPGETTWRVDEYRASTSRILDAYRSAGGVGPMPLEKDFSPTLAGSDLASARATILEWLDVVPRLIRESAPNDALSLGIKLFNAVDSDDFQFEMLKASLGPRPSQPDFLVYANRLFDPLREFEGKVGVAYGGPDLSDRNLRILSRLQDEQRAGRFEAAPIELSATGNITTGKMAVEYGLRGCRSFQIHTMFQLPGEFYTMHRGSKLERALHLLYFHPDHGFIAWCHHLAARRGLAPGTLFHWWDAMDVALA